MILCPWKDVLKYAPVVPGLAEAVEKINALQDLTPATHPLTNGKFIVQQGTTKAIDKAEAHREFLDVQYILEGGEVMGWAHLDTVELVGEFDTVKDIGRYVGEFDYVNVRPGYCYIVFPEDVHMPGRHLETPNDFKKIVVKLKV